MRKVPFGGRSDGFALFIVVILLFTVGISAAAAYQLVFLQNRLSEFSTDTEKARTIAEAGLTRLFSEDTLALRGVMPDTLEYDFDFPDGRGGFSVVTTRRILHLDQVEGYPPERWEDLYRIHAAGRYTNPRYFEAPAVWDISVYARLRTPPVNVLATVATTGSMSVDPAVTLTGADQAPAGMCRVAEGGAVADYAENLTLAQLGFPPWPALLDPDYPVDVHWTGGAWSVPASPDYPVIRVGVDPFTAGNARSGHGVLIVPGEVEFRQNFSWDGIILAGGSVTTSTAPGATPQVRGVLVAGLAGGSPSVTLSRGDYRFHSCHVLGAGRSMGVLNPEPLSWWSAF